MSVKQAPSDWKIYADLIVKFIEEFGPMTRIELSEKIREELKSQGYTWNEKEKLDDGRINYATPYFRINSALGEIRKGSTDRAGGYWKGLKLSKVQQGKKIIYSFASGVKQSTTQELEKQITLGENLEVVELPKGMKKKSKVATPTNLPLHVSTKEYKEISDLLNSGEHLLLKGVPGIGKTWNAVYWALKNGYKIFKVVLTRESAEWQLIGRSNLILTHAEIKAYANDHDIECVKKCAYEKKSCPAIRKSSISIMKDTWVDGEFTQAVRHAAEKKKTMLIVDEVNFGDQSVVSGTLHSVLEDQLEAGLTIKDTGESISFERKYFRCVATMNPGTSGTNPLNEAFEDRFIIVPCELPDIWKTIVNTQVGKPPSDGIERIFTQIRDTGTIQKTVALRAAIKWTRLEIMYGDVSGSAKLQRLIMNQFEDNDYKVVKEIIKGAFRNP